MERVVSLAPSITEIFISLGIEEKLVGITNFCPQNEKMKVKKIGNWINGISWEEIIKLNPDTIIAHLYYTEEMKEFCKNNGIDLIFYDAHTLKDIFNTIRDIGKRAGINEEANKQIKEMENRIENVREEMKDISKKPKVYCEEFPEPPFCSGNWVSEIIEICNGISYVQPGKRSFEVSYEEINEWDPDIVILHWCGYGNNENQREIFMRRHPWNELRASREGNVFVIDDSLLNRPSPSILQGLIKVKEIIKQWSENNIK